MASKLVPATDVYQRACEWGFTLRTIQWYATEGLIPKPDKSEEGAVYLIPDSGIYLFLMTIKILKDDFSLPLAKIKKILKSYEHDLAGLNEIRQMLGGLVDTYQFIEPDPYMNQKNLEENNKRVNEIRERFIKKLLDGVPAEKLSVLQIEEEVDEGWF